MKRVLLLVSFCLIIFIAKTQNINIPDANFKNILVNSPCADFNYDWVNDGDVDTNNDGEISQAEALAVKGLFASYNSLSSLSGIEFFTNLLMLSCGNNQLTTLNLQGLSNLVYLYCDYNQLTTLNLQGVTNLYSLVCGFNQLSTLNLQGLTNLGYLYCSNNQLSTLNLQGLTNLAVLYCEYNQLTSLDVQDLQYINHLNCEYNLLMSLFIKNGHNEILELLGNENLNYICADEFQLSSINDSVAMWGLTNCFTNSYCSFTPGGQYYTIEGENKIDYNGNGCDNSDPSISFLKYSITNGSDSGSFLSNVLGHYFIPVQAGSHTITAVLENPTYFNISPSSFQVTFPDSISPYTQNFCITPNGTHHDLEVTILPMSFARPGFDAYYRLLYKNKGNQVENGTLSFYFDDARLDFVSSIPNPMQIVTDSLIWSFSNLMPMETRSIDITFNVNSPMETPAVNAGDSLVYTAHINGGNTDETPIDNNFTLHQTVVNSYDPNDKTCLEGETITPEMVGNFVHYLIRFENTGTFPAENIVVKDVIDTSRFDINSLQVQSASHSMYTRIKENIVEFIFENIQLPFDSASNDGYVAFKIKTKANLVLGDSLKNKAEIYFDYNFPIITNEAQTVVQNLVIGIKDVTEEVSVSIYPNPASEILLLQTENKISKAEIFDAMGRLVMVAAVNNNKINIGKLDKGVYYLRAFSQEKVFRAKWVKE